MGSRLRVLFVGKNASQGLKASDASSIATIARKLGIEIAASINENPASVICVDFKVQDIRILRKAKRRNLPTALVMFEPEVVIPQHGSKHLDWLFQRVIRVGRPNQDIILEWPQTWRQLEISKNRINSVVLVNADKWSFISGQYYWLRIALATSNSRVNVYGHGWDRSSAVRMAHRLFELCRTIACGRIPNFKGLKFVFSRPRNYLGVVEDKVKAMSKYKVALVIENSAELITEKLFDAWFAGCIPIYVGPKLETFGLPENLVVCSEDKVSDINLAIEKALAMNHDEFLVELGDFLEKARDSGWNSDASLRKILRAALPN
jgi:hypothetical protein